MSAPRVHKCLHPRALPMSLGLPLVPCGQCAECLHSQANQLAVRVFRECQFRGPFFFVTLTYRSACVPIYRNQYRIDKDSGELEVLSSGITDSSFFRGLFNDFAPFDRVRNKRGKMVKRMKPYVFENGEFLEELYYSVDYRDFQKVMKAYRIDFCRRFGVKKVEDKYPFKMFVVPEYGGVSYRPHYHLCCLGLPLYELESLLGRWRKRFGFTYVERVRCSGDSSDFARVSAYLSKYACKGSFDCPFIRQGYCLKPRRGFSRDFGVGDKVDFDKMMSYWQCKDVYPDLDFNNPDSYPGELNLDLFASRRHYCIGKLTYPLPSYFKRKAFYHKVPDYCFLNPAKWKYVEQDNTYYYEPTNKKKKIPQKVVATSLQRMVTAFVLDNAVRDLLRESGFKVLPPSDFSTYRKGFRCDFSNYLDSFSSSPESSSGSSFVISSLDASLSNEFLRVRACENEFRRSLFDSLF